MIHSTETITDDFNPPQPRYYVVDGQIYEQWVVRPGDFDAGIVPWEDVFKALTAMYTLQRCVSELDFSLDMLKEILPKRVRKSDTWKFVRLALKDLGELVE